MMPEENIELIHLIYASRAAQPFTEEELVDLLNGARTANSSIDVTGMLLHCEGSFFQVLEGEEEIVSTLYNKISKDPRHEDIVKIIKEPIEERAFGEWSMGYARAQKEQLKSISGLNDFFQGKKCLGDIDTGRARKLLTAYADGNWRQA